MLRRNICAALLIVALGAVQASAATKRPVRAEDLFRLSLISAPVISPDGNDVAFVVSRMNGPDDRYDTNVWLAGVSGGTPREITSDGMSSSPAWSPDASRIAFVRSAGAAPQIFTYNVRTSTVTQLTRLSGGASSPLWSHDGKRIAFMAITIDAQPPAQIDFRDAGFTPKPSQRSSDIRVIDTERYEANGEGYIYNKHAHLWVMNADGTSPHALTSGHRWSETQYAWSPDDSTIAFASLRRETARANESDIYTIPSNGGQMTLLHSTDVSNTQPAYAHRGNRVFFFSGNVDNSAEYPALVSSDPGGGDRATVVKKNAYQWGDWVLADLKMPGMICGPLFAPGDRTIVTVISTPGSTQLVAIDASNGNLKTLTNANSEVADCTMSANGRYVAYTKADYTHPAEVYVRDFHSGTERALTALNQPYLDTVTLSQPQRFTIHDAGGFGVDAWFMPAIGPQAKGKRPTLLDIHGGPQAEFGATFFHELQYWTGRGYNVVFVNPEGSIGYGHAFEAALEGNWGAPMFDDITRVMDEVTKRPTVDPSRFGVIGGSYGGYATLWIISHTDRFKAAVAERPASDIATESLDAFFASSNGLGGQYAWGKPWDPSSKNFTDSPLTYVTHIHTPVMLLHSTEDTETPIDQTLDEFSALKQLGRTARFVEVPNENHDLNRTGAPIHRVERLHLLASWFDYYLTP